MAKIKTKKRGESNGLIIKNGYIIGKWGDTKRVDMTFSVTKSYLSTVAGIAYDRKLISLDDNLKDYIWDGKFDDPHNSQIIWHHLLNQSSQWSGEEERRNCENARERLEDDLSLTASPV